jgi:hypothetical protein
MKNLANVVSKNPSIHTDFINVNLILVKNAPKESFSKTPVLLFQKLAKFQKNSFLGKSFFGCTFYKAEIDIF